MRKFAFYLKVFSTEIAYLIRAVKTIYRELKLRITRLILKLIFTGDEINTVRFALTFYASRCNKDTQELERKGGAKDRVDTARKFYYDIVRFKLRYFK